MEPTRRRWWRILLSPWVLVPSLLLALLVGGVLVYRASHLAGLPDIGGPFDVAAFGTVSISSAENAYVEYNAAAAGFTELTPWPVGVDLALEQRSWDDVPSEARQWLEDQRPVLLLWRQGTEKPDALYIQPKDLRIITMLPALDMLRSVSRLARLEALRHEAVGDVAEAWGWLHATFRSSRHCGRHAAIIERLVGIAIHASVADDIERWSRHPAVTAELLRQALSDVQTDYDTLTEAYSTALKVEYLVLSDLLARPEAAVREFLALGARTSPFGLSLGGDPSPTAVRLLLFLKNEPETSRRVFQQVFANLLLHADTPRPARPATTGSLDLFPPSPSAPLSSDYLTPGEIERLLRGSWLANVMMPALGRVQQAVDREQAKQAALVTALAVQIYRREHGRLPEAAADLVGPVLKALPADPYSPAGDPIQYRRTGEDHFVVWSLGPNGIDEGGVIGENPEQADMGFDTTPAQPPIR